MDKLLTKMLNNEFNNMKDFKYFSEKYIGVQLYDNQKELSTIIDDNKYVILKKSRQTGATSFIIWKIVHDIITATPMESNISVVYVGFNYNICEHVKNEVLKIIYWLGGVGIIKSDRYNCKFTNGVNFKCVVSSEFVRANTINYLYVDEITHNSDIEKLMSCITQSVSGYNGRVLLISDNYEYTDKKKIINEHINKYKKVIWNWADYQKEKNLDFVVYFRKQYGFNAFMRE